MTPDPTTLSAHDLAERLAAGLVLWDEGVALGKAYLALEAERDRLAVELAACVAVGAVVNPEAKPC